MAASKQSELSLDPADTLVFPLDTDEDAPQISLRLTNPGTMDGAAAFKVKTTKPRRFLVRPSQGIVPPGATETVRIILLAQEKQTLVTEFAEEGAKDDSNKFLVQMVPISEEQERAIRSTKQEANDMAEMWHNLTSPPASIKQKKLKVAFGYPPAGARAAKMAAEAPAGAGEFDSQGSGMRGARPEQRNNSGGSSGVGDSQRLWDELRTLRKKYDDLVAFTVNLTAEKDLLQRSLDAAKEDLQREGKLRRQLEKERATEGGARPLGGGGKGGGESSSNFGVMHLAVAAVLAYLFARYWH